MSNHPFIIAEAGSCHEGSFSRALELIHLAKAAGADACKFQYWSSAERMRERRRVDDPTAYLDGSVLQHWLPLLSDKAHELGLEFMTTAYLPEDIAVVAPYVDRFKVASFENQDIEFIRAHGGYKKALIISNGMEEWPGLPSEDWDRFPSIKNLQCVSAYPTPLAEASLGAMNGGEMYFDGYSDHTRCVYTGGFAVSAGAGMLEVHFRLDDTRETCPDYVVALSPDELKEYIRLARLAYVMRGDGVKKPQPSEIPMMKHRVQG